MTHSIFARMLVALPALLFTCYTASSQKIKRQTDKHIVHQQERMVHKSWNRKNFTPTKGFLGLNYQYWLTWAWHPNYPKTDRRPLSANGPQTLRMGMVLAMQNTEAAYKLQSDTIRETAVSEAAAQSGLLSSADPLWTLYYKQEFEGLLDSTESDPLNGFSEELKTHLKNFGSMNWYNEERAELKERLLGAKSANMNRGSRLLSYHRMLKDYRKLQSSWAAKVRYAKTFLKITKHNTDQKNGHDAPPALSTPKTDREIADEILKNMY